MTCTGSQRSLAELGSKVLKIQLQPSSPSPEAPQPDQPLAGPPGLSHPRPSVPAPRIALFHSSPGWSDLATLQCSAESHRDILSYPSTMLPALSSLSVIIYSAARSSPQPLDLCLLSPAISALRGLQETRVAPREESGVLGFPSRRGLTPRGSLECNPEIPAFPGEEY